MGGPPRLALIREAGRDARREDLGLKVLMVRTLGLGDVACIGLPAAHALRRRFPDAQLEALTLGAGRELFELHPAIDRVHEIAREEWPDDLALAIPSFARIAERVAAERYDLTVNLDTWFMPCFLARLLADGGLAVEGNRLSVPVRELLSHLKAGTIAPEWARYPEHYMESSYPGMKEWTLPWWEQPGEERAYPQFYLEHCCALEPPFETGLAIAPDAAFHEAAEGRPKIALSLSSRAGVRSYKQAGALREALEAQGFFVWNRFDGSQPMGATLAQLAVTDLLITVPTAPQWLARLVGCPSLMLPGPFPPQVLGAERSIEGFLDCQFCYQRDCVEKIDFACLDVPVERLVAEARAWCAEHPRRGPN